MPCFRCGARQTDPVRGASPWKRGVRGDTQVLICPDCQRVPDLDLDGCRACGSIALIRRLGEVECRSCGTVCPADHTAGEPAGTDPGHAGDPPHPQAAAPKLSEPGLSEEVRAALDRVLGRGPGG
jgi:hypothetical protein